jgi:hypothetical protein
MGTIAVEVTLPYRGPVAAFFAGHFRERSRQLERFGIAELRKHFRELAVDIRVALFDKRSRRAGLPVR